MGEAVAVGVAVGEGGAVFVGGSGVAVGGTCVGVAVGGTCVGVAVGGMAVAEEDNVGAGVGCFDPEQEIAPSNQKPIINRKTIFFMIEPPFSIKSVSNSLIRRCKTLLITAFFDKQSLGVYVINSVAQR